MPEVAGVQPPVGVDGRGGGLGIVEVALHHQVAAGADLPDLAERHGLVAGRRAVIVTSVWGSGRPSVSAGPRGCRRDGSG